MVEKQEVTGRVLATAAVAFNDVSPAMAAYFANQSVAVRATGEYGRGHSVETVWWSDADTNHASFTRDPAEAKVWLLGEIYRIVRTHCDETRDQVIFERRDAQSLSGDALLEAIVRAAVEAYDDQHPSDWNPKYENLPAAKSAVQAVLARATQDPPHD